MYNTKILSIQEKKAIDKGLRFIRDQHHRNYAQHSNPNGDVAQSQKAIAESLDRLRGKVFDLWDVLNAGGVAQMLKASIARNVAPINSVMTLIHIDVPYTDLLPTNRLCSRLVSSK